VAPSPISGHTGRNINDLWPEVRRLAAENLGVQRARQAPGLLTGLPADGIWLGGAQANNMVTRNSFPFTLIPYGRIVLADFHRAGESTDS
jgi:hypothetical protein